MSFKTKIIIKNQHQRFHSMILTLDRTTVVDNSS